MRRLKRGFHGLNDRWRSERNVAHHYDLSGEMYGLFLDSERQYTCAYHPTGTEDLETGAALQGAAHRGQAAARAWHARRSTSAAAGAASPHIWPAITMST